MPNIPSFDIETILKYVDIGYWVLLGLVLGGMLLAFFRGLFRGWKHGTYRLIFLTALTVTLLLLMPVWINIVGGLPLGNWIPGPIELEIEGTRISVPITTGFDTVYDFIYTLLKDVFKVRASTESIIAYSIAFAGSIIRLVLVVVIALLVNTIGSFLSWILWHLIFKRFMSKEKRKPRARVISGLEDALIWFALLALTVIPFSGLANAIRNNVEVPEDETNETLVLINRVLDSYENSVFNKVFFEWTKGSGNKTLDTQIAEFFAQNSYKSKDGYESQANFIKEFSVLASVEGTLARWMISEDPSQSTVSSLIHTSLLVGNTLYDWARASETNDLLTGLVPLTLDVARNIETIEADYASDVDTWLNKDEAEGHALRLQKSYARVSGSDYLSTIDDVFQGDYAVPLYDSSCAYPDSYLDIVRKEIDASPRHRQMVNSVISGYVYGQLESNPSWQEGHGALPALAEALDVEAVESIDWWKEANILHDADVRLNALAPKEANSSDASMDSMVAKLTDDFMKALARDPYGLIEILVGKRDEKGEPVTDSKGNNQAFLCLLDSDLLAAVLPVALEIGADYLDTEILKDEGDQQIHDEIAELAAEFQGASTKECRVNFKREFGALLDVPGKIADSEVGKAFIKDYKSHPGVDFAEDGSIINIDPAIAQAIQSGLVNLDRSKVLNTAAAPVANHFLQPLLDPVDGALGKLGITQIALYQDYEGKRINIGQELSNLLNIGVYCNDIVPILGAFMSSTGDTSFPVSSLLDALFALEDADSHYQLTHLLDIICDSKVFNPVVKEGEQLIYNTNISGILDNLLSQLPDNMPISIDTSILDGLDLTSEWNGDQISDTNRGESFYMLKAMKVLVDTGLISKISDLSGASTSVLMSTLHSLPIEDIFTAIGGSAILRETASSLFDTLILKNIFGEQGYEEAVAYGVTYKNLITPQDWEHEGVAIASIIDLAYRGLDISQLDLFNPNVIDMLEKLSTSGMFYSAFTEEGTRREEKEYVFPTFLRDKLMTYLNTKDVLKLFTDYPKKLINGRTIDELLADSTIPWSSSTELKNQMCSVFCDCIEQVDTPEGWSQEFAILKNILLSIKAIGGMEALNNFTTDKLPAVSGAIVYLNQSRVFGPVLLSNIVHVALSSGSMPAELADTEINEGFLYYNSEQIVAARKAGTSTEALEKARKAEIDSIMKLLDVAGTEGAFNITISTLDVEGFLHPLLDTLAASKIFNPKSTDDLYPGEALPELTGFQSVVCTVMTKANLYTDADGNPIANNNTPVKGSAQTLKSIVKGIDDWASEIASMCDLVETLQSSSFIDGTGNFNFDALQDLDSYFARSGAHEELQYMLNSLMESKTFYRCLPPKLDDAIHNSLTGMTLRSIDKDLQCADFFYTRNGAGTDFSPYSPQEVDNLITILEKLAPCMHMSTSDLTTIDIDALSESFEAMSASAIFNSNTELSKGIAWEEERKGKTCFQLFVTDIVSVDALEGYLFDDDSPKDQYYIAEGVYADALGKEIHIVTGMLPRYDGTNADACIAATRQHLSQEWGDCLRTLQSSSFEKFFASSNPDMDQLSEDNLASLLHCLNECTIYRDCVPNVLYQTITKGETLQWLTDAGIDMGKADFFFSYYYHDGHGHFSGTRNPNPNFDMPFYAPELDQITMLYSLLKNNQSLIDNPVLKNLDAVALRSVLYDVHDSYIFHVSSRNIGEGDLTLFQQFIKTFLVKSGLYDQSLEGTASDPIDTRIIHGTGSMTIKKLVASIADNQWSHEIENIYGLLLHVQSTDSFTDSSGNLDLSVIGDLDTFFPKGSPEADATRAKNKNDLETLVRYVEEGGVLYRSLPAQLESAFQHAFSSTNDLMIKIEKDFECADYFCTSVGAGDDLDFLPYTHFDSGADPDTSEIEALINMFEDLSFFKGDDVKLTDLSTVNQSRLASALKNMGISRIFNSNTEKSLTVFSSDATRQGFTCHQLIVWDTIYDAVVHDYYYLSDSPKDQYYVAQSKYGGHTGVTEEEQKAAYNLNVAEKINYTIGLAFPILPKTEAGLPAQITNYLNAVTPLFDEWDAGIDKLKDPTYSDFISGTVPVQDLSSAQLVGLLKTLNGITFYRDAVPNAFHKTLNTLSISGVDFASADPFFSYFYDFDGNGEIASTRYNVVSEARLANPFYEQEIETIADIYNNFKANKTLLSNIDMSDATLPGILNGLLVSLKDSYTFHVSRADGGRLAMNELASASGTFQDLSIFEQMVYKFLHDTTMDAQGYLKLRDYKYEVAENGDALSYGAQYKLHQSILDYTASKDWTIEINSLTTDDLHHAGTDDDPVVGIIAAGQSTGMFGGGSAVSMDFESVKSAAPGKIKSLLYAINMSDLLKDVLPNTVSNLMGGNGVGLNKFSSLDKVDGAFDGTSLVTVNNTTEEWAFVDGNGEKFHGFTTVSFNVTGDPTDKYHVYVTDGLITRDLAGIVTLTYSAPKATFNLEGLRKGFRIELEDSIKVDGDVTFTYDLSSFDIGREGYANTGIRGMGYLLSSAYRGKDSNQASKYFTFEGDTLQSFLTETAPKSYYQHSTYGMLSLFGGSGFYGGLLNQDDKFVSSIPGSGDYYSAGSYAFYHALNFDIEAPIALDLTAIGIMTPYQPSATISISKYIGEGSTDISHMKAITDLFGSYSMANYDNYVREAIWFDRYATSVGTLDLYNDLTNRLATSDHVEQGGIDYPIPSKLMNYVLVNFVDKTFTGSHEAIESVQTALSSLKYDYDINIAHDDNTGGDPMVDNYHATGAVSDFGRDILRGLANGLSNAKSNTVQIDTVTRTAAGATKKSSRIADPTAIDDLSVYRISDSDDQAAIEAKNDAFDAYLGKVSRLFPIMELLFKDAPLSSADKTALKNAYKSLDDTALKITDLFYLASFYDQMLEPFEPIPGISIGKHSFFKVVMGMPVLVTDFPNIGSDGKIGSVDTPFSYTNIASTVS